MTKVKTKKKPTAKNKTVATAKIKTPKVAPKVKAPKPKKEARATKTSIILNAMRQDDGSTVEELAAAASWQNHSVRGFLSTLAKKGQKIEKFTRSGNGKTAYKIEKAGANG